MLPLALVALAAAAGGCPAPVVRTDDNPLLPKGFESGSRWIAPAPGRLYAVMWAGRAVDGKFSVYAHGFDPVTGTNEKIMWTVPHRMANRSGYRLTIEWRRGGETVLKQAVRRSGERHPSAYTRRHWVPIYPSTLKAPSEGCWKLRIRTGRITATMYALVQPQPAARLGPNQR